MVGQIPFVCPIFHVICSSVEIMITTVTTTTASTEATEPNNNNNNNNGGEGGGEGGEGNNNNNMNSRSLFGKSQRRPGMGSIFGHKTKDDSSFERQNKGDLKQQKKRSMFSGRQSRRHQEMVELKNRS